MLRLLKARYDNHHDSAASGHESQASRYSRGIPALTLPFFPAKINFMTTKEKNLISPKLLAELDCVLADVAKGKRNAEAMKKAARDMDRMREATRNELGTLDRAVDLIREGRDEK